MDDVSPEISQTHFHSLTCLYFDLIYAGIFHPMLVYFSSALPAQLCRYSWLWLVKVNGISRVLPRLLS